ncbi:MAG: arginine repressor [Eubacterium sp.]|nr:arginine repressor [Eubacterium sp.]
MKSKRQEQILKLIAERDIETQEELSDVLNSLGYKVTQATVSRDIRELRLFKTEGTGGRMKYASSERTVDGLSKRYINVFKEGFVSCDCAQNILVIKTVSGMAMAVAAALDAVGFKEIVGSIAGDDTIMCAIKTASEAEKLKERMYELVKE